MIVQDIIIPQILFFFSPSIERCGPYKMRMRLAYDYIYLFIFMRIWILECNDSSFVIL